MDAVPHARRTATRSTAWVATLAFVLAWGVARCAGRPPGPLASDAPAAQFSAERAATQLARVLGPGERPHPLGSAEHAAVRERLLWELRGMGLEPSVQDELVRGRSGVIVRVRNVLARISGKTAGPALVLAAHYDSVAAGPGASDDGAGVASLLEVARALLECGRAPHGLGGLEHPVILLFTDGEEVDLAGAVAFVERHPWAQDVRGVVNLEARGTCGTAWLFQVGPRSDTALARFAELARRPATSSIAAEVYRRMPNDTDFSVFRRAGWPGFDLAFIDGFARYHTPLDDLAHLDRASLQQLGENALAGLRALDEAAGEEHAELAWIDVLGRFVLRWPAAWSAYLALGALVLLGLAAVRRGIGPLALARGALPLALGAALGALATWSATHVVPLAHGFAEPWITRPALWDALCGALGLAAGLAAARAGPRANPTAAYLGTWIALGLAALYAGLALPSVSPPLVAPALAAGLAALFLPRAVLPREAHGARWLALALTPFAVLALLLLPLLLGIELAGAFLVGWPPGLFAGLLGATLAPLALHGARGPLALAVLAALSLSVASAFLRTPTADAPGWWNVVHAQRSDTARWHVQTFGDDPPPVPGATWGDAQPPVEWLRYTRGRTLVAPLHAEPRPSVEVVPGPSDGDVRTVRLRLRSLRGASQFALEPPGARAFVRAVRAGGHELAFSSWTGPVHLAGIDAEGVEIELEIRGVEPLALEVAEIARGLPESVRAAEPPRGPDRLPRSHGDVSVLVFGIEL